MDKELQIEQGPFTIEELVMVLRKTKKNKTAGLDEIPAELWKTGHFNHILLKFCNDVYSQKLIEYWTNGCILPFPNNGDLTVTYNYRDIILTCIADKIYNTLRIQPIVIYTTYRGIDIPRYPQTKLNSIWKSQLNTTLKRNFSEPW